MPDIKNIADKANLIINGYAFTCVDEWSQYSKNGYYEK